MNTPNGKVNWNSGPSLNYSLAKVQLGFPGGSVVKNLPANVRDVGSIPESGRSPGGGNGNPPTPVSSSGKSYGQRGLAGYKYIGSQRVRHD